MSYNPPAAHRSYKAASDNESGTQCYARVYLLFSHSKSFYPEFTGIKKSYPRR